MNKEPSAAARYGRNTAAVEGAGACGAGEVELLVESKRGRMRPRMRVRNSAKPTQNKAYLGCAIITTMGTARLVALSRSWWIRPARSMGNHELRATTNIFVVVERELDGEGSSRAIDGLRAWRLGEDSAEAAEDDEELRFPLSSFSASFDESEKKFGWDL